MNVFKRIIALITAAFIVIRVLSIQTFAFAEVVTAAEVAEFLAMLLTGSGVYTQSQVDEMSLDEKKLSLNDGLSSGTINPAQIKIVDPVSDIEFSFLEFITSDEYKLAANVIPILVEAAINDIFNPAWAEEHVVSTTTSDVNMKGAVSILKEIVGRYSYIYYCDQPSTIRFYTDNSGKQRVVYSMPHRYLEESYDRDTISWSHDTVSPFHVDTVLSSSYFIYGDWRYEDDTQAPTDDVSEEILGEADGTAITPDMLNPDGTVTINGTTYYPSDYVDWEKFDDTAILDLLDQILDKIDNTTVIVQDNTMAEDIIGDISADITFEEAGDLGNFQMPVVIADVFPFCLPFDFYKAVKLFNASPETPFFEVKIDTPAFLSIPQQHWNFKLDFEEFESLAKITRWVSFLGFVILLIFATGKIVKGGGA